MRAKTRRLGFEPLQMAERFLAPIGSTAIVVQMNRAPAR